MAFCSNCGTQIEDNAKFCPFCGTQAGQAENSAANTFQFEEPKPARSSGILNTKMLVWAIINLVACCTPLGIASLILTILAKDAPSAEDEAKKLKTAKTCNLIGTIGGVVYVLVCFVFGLIIGFSEIFSQGL